MGTITVNLGKRSYKILIEKNFDKLPAELKSLGLGTDAVIVTNPFIKSLFYDGLEKYLRRGGLRPKAVTVPDSEKAKSLKELARLLGLLSKSDGKGKRLCVIVLGGGVTGDLAGFAASVYKRGIPYVQIPTTLLAQVDSAIGGKTAVDLSAGKNLVGSFYQPRLVYINISLLKKLSGRNFISGIAEAIKYGVIKDRRLFEYLEGDRGAVLRRDEECLLKIVERCARIKAKIVSLDEREEKARRTILNFGHTFGHAIEAATGYSGRYSHGEAVGVGMLAASRVSRRLRCLSENDLSRIEGIIRSFGLPTRLKKIGVKGILKALSRDKKFIHGTTRLVLPLNIGRVAIKEGVSYDVIRRELNRLTS